MLQRKTITQLKLTICLGIIFLLGILDYFGFDPLFRLENALQDTRSRLVSGQESNSNIVCLVIDQHAYDRDLVDQLTAVNPTLAGMAAWPWKRDVHALLAERLLESGARVVAFDLLFFNPTPLDGALKEIAQKNKDKVVFGGLINEKFADTELTSTVSLPTPVLEEEDILEMDPGNPEGLVGYVNLWPDKDKIIRRVYLTRQLAQGPLLSFAGRILQKFGKPVDLSGKGYPLRHAGEINFKMIPIPEVFLPKSWNETFGFGKFFEGKIVLIGPMGTWANDDQPIRKNRQIPGIQLHASIVQRFLQTGGSRDAGLTATWMTLVLAGMLGFFIGIQFERLSLRFLMILFLLLSFFGGTLILETKAGFVMPLAVPCLAFLSTSFVSLIWDFVSAKQERHRIRTMFSTMVSPEVLRFMQEDPSRFQLKGEKREATIFFSDLSGFTRISEKLSATDLASLLNSYLTPMTEILLSQGAYIDKYEGDAIMADFGVPAWPDKNSPDSHAWKACWAALDQLKKMEEVRSAARERFGCELDVRIGINTGEVSAGNMGSYQKFQYTVMGDAVNVAARLEPANKVFGTKILIGENTHRLASNYIESRYLGRLMLKGKTESLPCFEPWSRKGELPDGVFQALREFEKGVSFFEHRKFDEATACFKETLDRLPDDAPSLLYVQECSRWGRTQPATEWTAAWTAEK